MLNGTEIGGGSVRVHDPVMQEYIFDEILQVRLSVLCSVLFCFVACYPSRCVVVYAVCDRQYSIPRYTMHVALHDAPAGDLFLLSIASLARPALVILHPFPVSYCLLCLVCSHRLGGHRSSFAVDYPLFIIRYSLSTIIHPPLVIRSSTFAVHHSVFAIRHSLATLPFMTPLHSPLILFN